jgi:hypothetical protein
MHLHVLLGEVQLLWLVVVEGRVHVIHLEAQLLDLLELVQLQRAGTPTHPHTHTFIYIYQCNVEEHKAKDDNLRKALPHMPPVLGL